MYLQHMPKFLVLLRGPGEEGDQRIHAEFDFAKPPTIKDLKKLVKEDIEIDVGQLNHLLTNRGGSLDFSD